MVCKDCETKLGRVAAPDTWKAGARNTMESGGRRLGENKLLSVKKASLQKTSRKCKECGQPCHQEQATLCHVCAYSKGVCAICGIQILDTSSYKMTGGSMVYHKVRGQEDASTAGPDQEEASQYRFPFHPPLRHFRLPRRLPRKPPRVSPRLIRIHHRCVN